MGGGGEITVFRDITFSYRKVPEQPMVQEPHGKKKKKSAADTSESGVREALS